MSYLCVVGMKFSGGARGRQSSPCWMPEWLATKVYGQMIDLKKEKNGARAVFLFQTTTLSGGFTSLLALLLFVYR